MKYLSIIAFLMLAGCSTIQSDNARDVRAVIEGASCTIETALPSGNARDAATLICKVAQGAKVLTGFTVAEQTRRITRACIVTADIDRSPSFDELWQRVCPERIEAVGPLARSITVTELAFREIDPEYSAPAMVWFRGVTFSPCGRVTLAAYCTIDRRFYVDDRAINRLTGDRDMAALVVVSHELAHHVQDRAGCLEKSAVFGATNADIRANERHADRAAGYVFAWFDADRKQARDGATVLARTGDILPGGTHGTAWQRVQAFLDGYRNGYQECDA